jgi:hypothetical protein
MQNSLKRLLDGISLFLEEHILDDLDNKFKHTQILAAIEILKNVGVRADWIMDDENPQRIDLESMLSQLAMNEKWDQELALSIIAISAQQVKDELATTKSAMFAQKNNPGQKS